MKISQKMKSFLRNVFEVLPSVYDVGELVSHKQAAWKNLSLKLAPLSWTEREICTDDQAVYNKMDPYPSIDALKLQNNAVPKSALRAVIFPFTFTRRLDRAIGFNIRKTDEKSSFGDFMHAMIKHHDYYKRA